MAIVSIAKVLNANTNLLAEAVIDGTIRIDMTGTTAMEVLNNNQTYKTFGDCFSVKQVYNDIACIKNMCTLPEDLKTQMVKKMTLEKQVGPTIW
jgi:hypothetical protein